MSPPLEGRFLTTPSPEKSHDVRYVLSRSLGPTLCNPVDYSLQAPLSIGILQASILEWVAISFSKKGSLKRKTFFLNWESLVACLFIFLRVIFQGAEVLTLMTSHPLVVSSLCFWFCT